MVITERVHAVEDALFKSLAHLEQLRSELRAVADAAHETQRALDLALALLDEAEWGDTDWESADPLAACCPWCHASKEQGHAGGCRYALLPRGPTSSR